MTVDIRPKGLEEAVSDVSKRLYKVEQRTSTPSAGGSGGMGSDPVVNTITIDGIVVGSDASPATNLSLITSAFMEDIWIDADWDAPVDGTASSYDVELSRKVGMTYELVNNFRTSGTSIRMAGLEPSQLYGVRVIAINRIGARSTPLPSSGFQDITTGIDATVPDQASNFQLTAGIRTVMATWNEVADRDVARGTGTYEVQLATDSGFTALFASKFTSATITSFSGVASSTTYWGRVRAVDNSGNAGAWSTSASVATVPAGTGDIGTGAVQTTNIAALAVGNAQIANLAVDDAKVANLSADKLTTGTLDANRIAANTIDVNKLTASTLSSKVITIGAGGTLKIGNAPTTGIFINDQGIRLYSGGVAKVVLDVAGTASFEGNISASTITSSTLTSATINSGTINGLTITGGIVRTAASGKRIELNSGGIDQLRFYSGHGSETNYGQMSVGAGSDNLNIDITTPRTGQNYALIQMVSRTNNTVPAVADISIRDPSGNQLQAFDMIGPTASVVGYSIWQGGSKHEFTAFTGSTGVVRLVGSGDYGFMYLQGGGGAATVVFNLGLGSGIQAMNGTVGSWVPLQASAFNIASSRQTKKNISSSPSVLDKLLRMQVKRYQRADVDHKAGVEEFKKQTPGHINRAYDLYELGFMAEEIMDIEPEAVVVGQDGPNAVSLNYIVAMLVKAVQEINGRIPGKA